MKNVNEHKARIKQDLLTAIQWMTNDPMINMRDQMVLFGGEASRMQPTMPVSTVRGNIYINATEVKLFLNANSHGDWELMMDVIRESQSDLFAAYNNSPLRDMTYMSHGQTWTEYHFAYKDSNVEDRNPAPVPTYF